MLRAFGEAVLVEMDGHEAVKRTEIQLLDRTREVVQAEPQWATVHSVGERVKDIETLEVGQRVYVAHAAIMSGNPQARRITIEDHGRELTLISAREILAVAGAGEYMSVPKHSLRLATGDA